TARHLRAFRCRTRPRSNREGRYAMTRTTPPSSVGLEAYLDSQRMNARHWAAFFLIALVLLADGLDVTIVSHIFPSLIDEWRSELLATYARFAAERAPVRIAKEGTQ